jgi:hypothetical protein
MKRLKNKAIGIIQVILSKEKKSSIKNKKFKE